jgi:hypothetical protein
VRFAARFSEARDMIKVVSDSRNCIKRLAS